MLIKFPDGKLATANFLSVIEPDVAGVVINVVSYGGGSNSYTCASAAEVNLFAKLINEALRRGDALLDLDTVTAATVTAILPAAGDDPTGLGGRSTIVTGTGFRKSGYITIDSSTCYESYWVSSTQFQIVTPPAWRAVGAARNVSYVDSRGTASGGNLYTYS